MITLHNKAIFIADAHYPHHGNKLIELLTQIDNATIQTTQLILMGDIFDLMFGYNNYIKKYNQKVIDLITKISNNIEVIYLEGNHDFCLSDVFGNALVIPRDKQPLLAKYQNLTFALSHGDLYDTGVGYEIYSRVLRNKFTLNLLKPWQKSIIDDRMHKLSQKQICHDFIDFEAKINRILKHYKSVDFIIEGHFHQAKKIDRYISLPSLVCQKQYGVFNDGQIVFREL
jgi:UDP-2,3-diacylglucosamine hydrolase